MTDKVYAHNCETGETGLKTVSHLFVHEAKDIAHVKVDGETIDATITHPFYVVGYGFQSAGNLQVGDSVLLLEGRIKKIEGVEIEHLEKPIKVYNFEVEDWHTYYVAGQGVLVHNMCMMTRVEVNLSYSYQMNTIRKLMIILQKQ